MYKRLYGRWVRMLELEFRVEGLDLGFLRFGRFRVKGLRVEALGCSLSKSPILPRNIRKG